MIRKQNDSDMNHNYKFINTYSKSTLAQCGRRESERDRKRETVQLIPIKSINRSRLWLSHEYIERDQRARPNAVSEQHEMSKMMKKAKGNTTIIIIKSTSLWGVALIQLKLIIFKSMKVKTRFGITHNIVF